MHSIFRRFFLRSYCCQRGSKLSKCAKYQIIVVNCQVYCKDFLYPDSIAYIGDEATPIKLAKPVFQVYVYQLG